MRRDDICDSGYSDGELDTNASANPTLQSIVAARYSRRGVLFSGMSATAAAVLGGLPLAACGGSDDPPTAGAGQNIATRAGRIVVLTGSAQDDKGVTGVGWTQTSGPPVALAGADTNAASFIAPSVSSPTNLAFRFTATDAKGRTATSETTVAVEPPALGFTAVAKNINDVVTVPAGYSATVLYRLGDPILAGVPAYANNGTDTNFAGRAGDHHDGLAFFGLAGSGTGRDDNSNSRGLLVNNHENITQRYLHPNGATTVNGARPEAEVIKEMEAHGVSVVEVARGAAGWAYVQGAPLNRRITPSTPMALRGPAAGSIYMRTAFSPNGAQGRGTINNCAAGPSYWGTYLTCEENWAGYFRRNAADNAARTPREAASLNRYGVTQGAAGNYGWSTVTPSTPGDTRYARWNASATAGPADGSGDFRNEPNQFGWVVEIDPYDPNSTPRKRTALGRMGHENAQPVLRSGQRVVVYMGDDARNEYFYKFVSNTPWNPADANVADRLAVGDKYLDVGTLYVARFDASGSGVWLPLTFGTGPLTSSNAAYAFQDQADVLINTRLAADAVGATKMDRPEWVGVNPLNGEVYLTLTNTNAASRPLAATDAANPRHYNDPRTNGAAQRGNPNGHIIRLRETGNQADATTFAWDIYAFGAGADLDPQNVNLSGLDASNDFSSPDGLWFSRPTNAGGQAVPLMWIQTDDGAYTDVTNNMMLAAQPGVVGDGGARSITNNDGGNVRQQSTIVGRAPGMNLRRFLVGPKECEITGIDTTPDGQTMFVNIQHPGEDTTAGFPNTFPSNWPASQTNPAAVSRPRSATVVITKDGGGVVGL